jgi:hypothetical protein
MQLPEDLKPMNFQELVINSHIEWNSPEGTSELVRCILFTEIIANIRLTYTINKRNQFFLLNASKACTFQII